MAALGSTNISTSLVGTTLSDASRSVFELCTLVNKINKWSRYKPVRDAGVGPNRPVGASGYFGLDFTNSNPNKWDYLVPRGGSPGGSPDEPGRLGDFRGYEHDKSNTYPPVYADVASTNIEGGNFQPSNKEANVIPKDGTWLFGKNTTHDSVRLLPSDFGLDSYYWGVKLVSPVPATWYKTLGNLTNNVSIGFDMKFTDPAAVTFVDFPADDTLGQWTWQLFISSTTELTWTNDAPDDIIYLPTDAGIPSLISSNHFHLLPYLVFGIPGYTVVEALPSAGGNFPYTVGSLTGTPGTDYDFGIVNTNDTGWYTITRYENDGETPATWFHFRVYDATNTASVGTLDDEGGADEDYLDGTYIRVYCSANTGNSRTGILNLELIGAQCNITINQAGCPPTFNHNPLGTLGWSAGPTATAGYADVDIHITGTPTGFYGGGGTLDMYVWVEKGGVQQGDPLIFGAHDGTAYDKWIEDQNPLDSSTYQIYYGTQAEYEA